ncbi:MAG: hypothetical protein HWN68_00115 [Desulfobacterales bacterium]|nr:hypothetical protein [Desulfobacterales bacterium]
MTTRLWAALLLIAVATWFGCAPKLRAYRATPAEVSSAGIRTLAVLRFDGPYGETVRGHVYNRLAKVEHFRPIDALKVHGLNNVMYDQVDDPGFLRAIEKLKAYAVLAGRVTSRIHDIHGADQVESQEGTGHYKKGKDLSGRWVNVEIKRAVVKPVPHIIRQACVATEYKLFDLKTKLVIASGKLKEIYDEKFGGDKEQASCEHKLSDLPAQDSTMDELAAKLAAKLVEKISRRLNSKSDTE